MEGHLCSCCFDGNGWSGSQWQHWFWMPILEVMEQIGADENGIIGILWSSQAQNTNQISRKMSLDMTISNSLFQLHWLAGVSECQVQSDSRNLFQFVHKQHLLQVKLKTQMCAVRRDFVQFLRSLLALEHPKIARNGDFWGRRHFKPKNRHF